MARRPTNTFNVYLNGKHLDTVFYNMKSWKRKDLEDKEDVRRALINHDGYHPNITVRRVWQNASK